MTQPAVQWLSVDEWRERQWAHRERVDPWVQPRLERRSRGAAHPIDDFLFDYYSYRPGQLRRWHPGFGVALAGSARDLADFARDPEYVAIEGGVTVSEPRLARHRERLEAARDLLTATRDREPRWGCFGLHEWAMVYRLPPDAVRHSSWPLRLTPGQIAEVVELNGLRCTHFDAFRFYTDAARPLNELTLSRAGQVAVEQPGCLHATMDLYKIAYQFAPFVDSELVADAFDLAREVREVDMRASPYDTSTLGLEPIMVEASAGRREFVDHQRRFAALAAPLRERLLRRIEALLGTATPNGPSNRVKGPTFTVTPTDC